MLPFIIGGGVVVGGIIAIFKEKCSVCDSYFTLNEPCLICGSEVCSDCGKDIGDLGRCCKKHGNIDFALSKESGVRVVSNNYKGKIEPPRFSRAIETAFYRDKDNAGRALRFIAVINGADVVQNVDFIRSTGSSGNYKFAIWKATGVI